MVRVISIASLGFDYGVGCRELDGLDFSTVLEDNPSDDMILKAISSKKSKRKQPIGTKSQQYSVPEIKPAVALTIKHSLSR